MAVLSRGGPFEEGFHSFHLGLSRTRCPYAPGTTEHRTWVSGWAQAERQDDDEEAIEDLRADGPKHVARLAS